MNKAKPKIADPSIDDMLTSIRDAIHEETAREAEEHARTFKPRAEPRQVPSPQRAAPPAQRAAPSVQTSSPAPVPPQPVKSRASAVSGSMRELRVSLQPAGQANTRGTVTARSEDFLSLKNKLASLRESQPVPAGKGSMAGLMGGDVRLEDALERMNTAEQLQRENVTPPRTEVPPPPLPQAEPPMRATIDDAPADQFHADFALEQPVAEHELEQTEASPEIAPKIDIVTEQPAPETFRPMPEPVFEAAPPAPVEPVYEAPEIVAAPLEASIERFEAAAPVEVPPAAPAPIEPVAVEPARMEPAIVLPRHQERLPVQTEPAQMISIDAMQAATSAFDRLSDQMFKRTSGGEQVLEDSARDMIRPMLKKWLDDNLPSLVERLVRDEIERVARKGGR